MVEMVKMELDEAKSGLPDAEEVLKVALIPRDPNDDRNCIVEIRTGVGGDESALFAEEDIKLRSAPYKNFMTAGLEDAFVHVVLRVLSGRTLEQKQALSQLVLEALTQFPLTKVYKSVLRHTLQIILFHHLTVKVLHLSKHTILLIIYVDFEIVHFYHLHQKK